MRVTLHRTGLISALLLACLGGIVAVDWLRAPPQVSWKGRSIQSWFRQYCEYKPFRESFDPAAWEQAANAFRQIGPSATPFLIGQVRGRHHEPLLARHYYQWRLHSGLTDRPYVSAEDRAREALDLLRQIRPPAELVLASLKRNPRIESDDPESLLAILGCVGSGTPQVMPFLVRALANPDPRLQSTAAAAALQLGRSARDAWPALTALLRQESPPLAVLRAVGSVDLDVESVLPDLERLLGSTNEVIRLNAAVALCRIASDHAVAFGFLRDALESRPEDRDADVALRAISAAGPGTPGLITLLEQVAARRESRCSARALMVLERLDPTAAAALLRRGLEDDDELVERRIWMAGRLLALDPLDPVALAFLERCSRSNQPAEIRAYALAVMRQPSRRASTRP